MKYFTVRRRKIKKFCHLLYTDLKFKKKKRKLKNFTKF